MWMDAKCWKSPYLHETSCTVKFGVYTHPLCAVHSFQIWGRRSLRIRTQYSKCTPMYHFCVHVYCTDSMHLQSTMQVLVCVYESIHTVLRVAYVTYVSVQIYYKLESTLHLCKLRGGRIHRHRLLLCKTLALKMGVSVYPGVGLYSEFTLQCCWVGCFKFYVTMLLGCLL